MTLIIRNIEKLFQPDCKSLDAKLWVQKLILKKYLKKLANTQKFKERAFK